jgi:RNA polymerase sigma-70 factor (ECF subfamily)
MRKNFETDAELIAAMLSGDRSAFECFFHTHHPRLFRFALRRLDRPDLAEEVAQEALIEAIERLEEFRGEAALSTWVTAICRSSVAQLRRRRTDIQPVLDVLGDDPEVRAALERLGGDGHLPDHAADRMETILVIQAVLDALPPVYGDLLEWKYVDGLSIFELAERLGRSPKAIESLLTRAREAFRDVAGDVFSLRTTAGRG